MTASDTFSSFNLMGNFSWSSSSSSTPQYSPQASLPLSREQSLTVLTAEFSSSPVIVATGSAETRATAPAGATCISAPPLDHLGSGEERVVIAANTPSKVFSTRRSSNAASECPDLFGTPTPAAPATVGPLSSTDFSKTQSIGGRRESAARAAFSHGRQSTALPAPSRFFHASPAVARHTSSAGRKVIDVEGGEARERADEGRYFRRVRLVVSRLQPRAPLRDAAVSSVSCGCYIFLLAASLRFFFHCTPDTGSPLQAASVVDRTVAASNASSVLLAPSSFPEARSRRSLVAGSLSPAAEDGELIPSLSFPSHLAKSAFTSFTSSPFPSVQRSSAPRAFSVGAPAAREASSFAPPSPSSNGAFKHSSVASAAAIPSSSSFRTAASPINAVATTAEWLPAGLYHRVAYRLCAAWAAAGACAAIAALLVYRNHGGIVTATSMLDVRFPVREEPASMDREKAEAEGNEKEAHLEETDWPALNYQGARAIETAEERESREAEEERSADSIVAAADAACDGAEGRREVGQGERVAEAPLQLAGTSEQQQGQLHTHGDDLQQHEGADETVNLSQQLAGQQQQPNQHQQLDREPEKDQEDRAGGRNTDESGGLLSEQAKEASRSNEEYRKRSVYNAKRRTPQDYTRRRHKSVLGISFMGQGQTGSIAAAIRRGSVASALSGGNSGTSCRLQSTGSNVSRSSTGPAVAPVTDAILKADYRYISCSPSGSGAAAAAAAALYAVAAASHDAPATSGHPGSQRSSAPHPRDCERRKQIREVWLRFRSPRQQQQHVRQQFRRMHQERLEPRLVPLLASAPLPSARSRVPFRPRSPLGSWTASCVSLAIGGGLCACLQEFLLFLAVAVERQRPILWTVVTCLSFSDWLFLELIASVLRFWSPLFPRWRARGALVAATANAVLLLLLRSISATRLTQPSQVPPGLQSPAETSKDDRLLQEAAPPTVPTEETTKTPVAHQNATVGPAPGDGSGLVIMLAVAASISALLADVSLAFSLESGVSVLSTVIIRCSTQGAVGAAGILHGLVAGDPFLKGTNWLACSPALFCPALAGVTFGPLAVYAFAQSVKNSTVLLGATVRSTCWVVVALLALAAHGQRLSSVFASALALTFAGTCLFAWDSRRGACATRQGTDDSSYDYRISNAANEHEAFSCPVYHELIEDGHCSAESSFLGMGNKPDGDSNSRSVRRA